MSGLQNGVDNPSVEMEARPGPLPSCPPPPPEDTGTHAVLSEERQPQTNL